jgi:sodium/pantothenate symporter
VLVLMLAFFLPPRIFWVTYFAATVFASSWGPVAFMSVWSKSITADAAFWGIVVGFFGNIITKALSYFGIVALPVWADPIILGAAMSTLAIVLVSRRGIVSEAEQRYRRMLHEVPEAELDPLEIRSTRRWSVILIAGGIALSMLMIYFWAMPYRAATGSAGVLTGEVWVSLGCGFVLVACGWTIRTLTNSR